MLAAIDSIYATHRAKHGREVPLGADELFPIFVYVLVNSDVSQIPTFIEMMSRNLDQASKGAYYAITGFAAVQFINNQLDLPGTEQPGETDGLASSELEPEPEPQLRDAVALGMSIARSPKMLSWVQANRFTWTSTASIWTARDGCVVQSPTGRSSYSAALQTRSQFCLTWAWCAWY